jgi:hypothetical protein
MNYSELAAAVASTTVNEFADADMARFAQLTEQKVYNAVQIPALRKNVTGNLTPAGPYLTLPTDFLYPYSLAVIDGTGAYSYLLDKDVSFIRSAYPTPLFSGLPKYYAIFDKDTAIVGPTPDTNYSVELHYGYYPESIVTAGTSWLGDNFDSVLLNGMLVEAARFMKEEVDVVALYTKMFDESMMQLKRLGDGLLRMDAYRTPQVRVPVV